MDYLAEAFWASTRGWLLEKLNRTEEALEAYEWALTACPQHAKPPTMSRLRRWRKTVG